MSAIESVLSGVIPTKKKRKRLWRIGVSEVFRDTERQKNGEG